jgi:heptosyltransferase II
MIEKILVVAPSWVGDLVMSQSLFRHLLAERPGVQIDILVPEYCMGIAAFMPEVTECIPMPVGHGRIGIKQRLALAKTLKAKAYTEAIVLPNSFKSALIPFFARIPKRTGWLGELRYIVLNDTRRLDKKLYPTMVDRFVALAYPKNHSWPLDKPFLLPRLKLNREVAAESLDKMGLSNTPSIIALAPSAAFGHFLSQEKQVWLLGGPKDEVVLEQIHILAGKRTRILGGSYSLEQKVIALSHAKLLISNDSGLLHVGAAIGLPVVAIYGSTTPNFTPPLTPHSIILEQKNLACRPCFKRSCPLKGTAHLACLKNITPEQAIQAASELLQRKDNI